MSPAIDIATPLRRFLVLPRAEGRRIVEAPSAWQALEVLGADVTGQASGGELPRGVTVAQTAEGERVVIALNKE